LGATDYRDLMMHFILLLGLVILVWGWFSFPLSNDRDRPKPQIAFTGCFFEDNYNTNLLLRVIDRQQH
jgi:hypothetical protein